MTRPSDLIFEIADSLAAAGWPSPAVDARIIVAHASDSEIPQLFLQSELSDQAVARSWQLTERRMAGEPIQYITGEAHFRFEKLWVGPGVFIPRPETELVAGWAIQELAQKPFQHRRFVELCAGSGAISRSLLREVAGTRGFVNELSAEAGTYLNKNLAGLDVRIELGNLADCFVDLEGSIDLVIANPPYIPAGNEPRLPRDVLDHEPSMALFSGPDGLTAIRKVVVAARRLLKPGGAVVCEHDESHQYEVIDLFKEQGFTRVIGHLDLTERDRFVSAFSPA